RPRLLWIAERRLPELVESDGTHRRTKGLAGDGEALVLLPLHAAPSRPPRRAPTSAEEASQHAPPVADAAPIGGSASTDRVTTRADPRPYARHDRAVG